MTQPLAGVITAVITPFDGNDKVDLNALDKIIQFLIGKGVNGLFPVGTTGEMFKLTAEERMMIAETVVKAAAKRVPVCIHVGAMSQSEAIRLARHAEKIGADYIASVTPSYFTANATEIEEYFAALASSVSESMPLYLYNIPQLAGNMLTSNIVGKVASRCKNVIGVKYSNSDLLLTYEYLTTAEGFSVLQGTDRCFLPALLMGCAGTVSGISCVYPEPFVALYKAYKASDLQRARELQCVATDYCDMLKHGSNMAYLKAGLDYRGIPGGHMRRPHLDIDAREKERFLQALELLNKKHSFLFKHIEGATT